MRIIKKTISLIACFTAFQLFSTDLPQPYKSINILPEYDFGYYYNAQEIEDIFNINDIHVVLEVGSWIGGGSTKHFGKLLKEKQGIVYAIDTWLGSTTQQVNQIHWQPVLDYVYHQFLSNMIHWNLTDVVIPCRMQSKEAAKALNVHPDLIYLDGEHTTAAVYEDLTLWYPFVKNRGILCGDDWGWLSVQEAVQTFAINNNLKVEASGNFWCLHEPKNSIHLSKEQLLINHLKNSIELGSQEKSNLNQNILNIQGMSSPKVRHFLNNLCTLPNSSYLEIGVWKGSTFVSALYQNQNTISQAIGIDNWSEFGGPLKEFLSNTAYFLSNAKYQFHPVDSFTIDKSIFKQPVNIYFYDGTHTPLAQELAFTYYNDILDDVFIAVVDDWNSDDVKNGTYAAFKKLNYEILFEQILPANFNGDIENWWNGLYVAVIRK